MEDIFTTSSGRMSSANILGEDELWNNLLFLYYYDVVWEGLWAILKLIVYYRLRFCMPSLWRTFSQHPQGG